MTDKKISALSSVSPLGTDRLLIERGNVAYQISVSSLLGLVDPPSGGVQPVITPFEFTVDERLDEDELIGTFSVPDGCFATIVEGWDQGGRLKLTGDKGQYLRATSIPLIYAANPAPQTRIHVETLVATEFPAVEQDVIINLNDLGASGPTASINLDMVRNAATGTTFAAQGIDPDDFDAHGLPVNGASTEYLFPNSMNLHSNSGVGTAQTPASGFTPIAIGQYSFAGITLGVTTRSFTVGERFLLLVKFSRNTPQGWRIGLAGAATMTLDNNNPSGDTEYFNAAQVPENLSFLGWTQDETNNCHTAQFLCVADANAALTVKSGTYDSGGMVVWGVQVVTDPARTDFVATGASATVISGNAPVAGGALDTLLKSSQWWLALEFGEITSGFPSNLLGHSTDGTTTVLQAAGRTHVTALADDSLLSVTGLGGFLGTSRLVIARKGTGTRVWFNGGEKGGSGTALTLTGDITILPAASAYLRRIEAGGADLTDDQGKTLSSLLERSYPDLDNETLYGPAAYGRSAGHIGTIFGEAGVLATRPSGHERDDTLGYASRAASFVGGQLIEGYQFYLDGVGSFNQLINGEEQDYVMNSAFGLGDSGGWNGPWTQGATRDGAQPGTVLVNTGDLLSNLPSAARAIINARWNGGVGGWSGTSPQKFVAGAATTLGRDLGAIPINSVFECRVKTADAKHIWDAFWAEDLDGIELDMFERPTNGIPNDSRLMRPGAHWDFYQQNFSYTNYDMGIKTSDDWLTCGAIWLSGGRVAWTICGKVFCIQTLGGNFAKNSTTLFLLINLAIGGNYAGATTSETDDAMPVEQLWNWLCAHRLAVPASTLGALTLSGTSILGQTAGSTIRIAGSTGTATLNGTTLTGTSGVVVTLVETLPTATNPIRVSTVTIA